jgi:hypothetical protein
MARLFSRTHAVEVTACAVAASAFRWVIRSPEGSIVERSPYAFASREGARISGECWCREWFADRDRRSSRQSQLLPLKGASGRL